MYDSVMSGALTADPVATGVADGPTGFNDEALAAMREVDEVRDVLSEIAGHRNALDGRLVDVAIWLSEHDAWQGEGLHRPEQFLAWRCGLTTQAARRYVQVADRADELPETVDALRRGELSIDQAMPIVRDVPAWAEAQVVGLATMLTPSQIRRLCRDDPFDEDEAAPDACDARDEDDGDDGKDGSSATPPDRGWMGDGDDGRFRLSIECSSELGDVIRCAVDEVRDHELRTTGNVISDAEALAIVAARSLDAVPDAARRDRYRTVLHIDSTTGAGTDAHGHTLPEAVARHLCCDGLITPVLLHDGLPVSVGRSQRIVPERTRRLVVHRDGGCRVPGCGATRHLEVHHIVHWTNGGPTDTWNLVTLCAHHHRLHHNGRLAISGNADIPFDGPGAVTFVNEHGGNMNRAGPAPRPPTGTPPPPTDPYTAPLNERLDTRWVHFRKPTRPAAVGAPGSDTDPTRS